VPSRHGDDTSPERRGDQLVAVATLFFFVFVLGLNLLLCIAGLERIWPSLNTRTAASTARQRRSRLGSPLARSNHYCAITRREARVAASDVTRASVGSPRRLCETFSGLQRAAHHSGRLRACMLTAKGVSDAPLRDLFGAVQACCESTEGAQWCLLAS
jgi:hypothetical protein